MTNTNTPRFITFEGPEGGGKSTQSRRLADVLRERGADVLLTRQPGGDPVGAALRRILLDEHDAKIDPSAELLMMMADRAQSVAHVIRPHLDGGGTVICDRYIDSSMAYQGYGRGIDHMVVQWLNDFATAGLKPDITFLLDTDPRAGLARQHDKTRMEHEAIAFHERVRAGFLAIAAGEPNRFEVVDASETIEAVAVTIIGAYDRKFG